MRMAEYLHQQCMFAVFVRLCVCVRAFRFPGGDVKRAIRMLHTQWIGIHWKNTEFGEAQHFHHNLLSILAA